MKVFWKLFCYFRWIWDFIHTKHQIIILNISFMKGGSINITNQSKSHPNSISEVVRFDLSKYSFSTYLPLVIIFNIQVSYLYFLPVDHSKVLALILGFYQTAIKKWVDKLKKRYFFSKKYSSLKRTHYWYKFISYKPLLLGVATFHLRFSLLPSLIVSFTTPKYFTIALLRYEVMKLWRNLE